MACKIPEIPDLREKMREEGVEAVSAAIEGAMREVAAECQKEKIKTQSEDHSWRRGGGSGKPAAKGKS